MRLRYLPEGDPSDTGAHVAGWPSSDHEEPDKERAAAKIASGLYAEDKRTPQRSDGAPAEAPKE